MSRDKVYQRTEKSPIARLTRNRGLSQALTERSSIQDIIETVDVEILA